MALTVWPKFDLNGLRAWRATVWPKQLEFAWRRIAACEGDAAGVDADADDATPMLAAVAPKLTNAAASPEIAPRFMTVPPLLAAELTIGTSSFQIV